MHRYCCRPATIQRIVPKHVYTLKKCSWGWANLSPETCTADLKRSINGICCILLVAYVKKINFAAWHLTRIYVTDQIKVRYICSYKRHKGTNGNTVLFPLFLNQFAIRRKLVGSTKRHFILRECFTVPRVYSIFNLDIFIGSLTRTPPLLSQKPCHWIFSTLDTSGPITRQLTYKRKYQQIACLIKNLTDHGLN